MTGSPTEKISALLRHKFPFSTSAQQHYVELLSEFWQSGLASPHMVSEIVTDDDGKFWSFLWEAMLYRHLRTLGFQFEHGRVTKAGQRGPDFGIKHEGRTVWIEAVVPAPEGIPAEFLFPKWGEVISTPHEAVMLRWTSSIADKQKQIARYIDCGLIAKNESAVIALNACRLSDHWIDDSGISQLPMALEAVFPVGPLAISIIDGKIDGEPIRVQRRYIKKPNAQVPTTTFLMEEFSHVSAVLGCVKKDMLCEKFPLSLVHNPLAVAPLPRRILGATKEFVADEQGDQYFVQPID